MLESCNAAILLRQLTEKHDKCQHFFISPPALLQKNEPRSMSPGDQSIRDATGAVRDLQTKHPATFRAQAHSGCLSCC